MSFGTLNGLIQAAEVHGSKTSPFKINRDVTMSPSMMQPAGDRRSKSGCCYCPDGCPDGMIASNIKEDNPKAKSQFLELLVTGGNASATQSC